MGEWPSLEQVAVWDPPREPAVAPSEVALRERIATGRIRQGLPMSDAILDEILDSGRDAGGFPGVFTAGERQDMLGDFERVEAARTVLAPAEDLLRDVEVGWRAGRRVVRVFVAAADIERSRELLAAALGADRVDVEPLIRSWSELEEIQERLVNDSGELAEAGIVLTGSAPRRGEVEISYFATDPAWAQAALRERYGDGVVPSCQGASPRFIRPQPFGS